MTWTPIDARTSDNPRIGRDTYNAQLKGNLDDLNTRTTAVEAAITASAVLPVTGTVADPDVPNVVTGDVTQAGWWGVHASATLRAVAGTGTAYGRGRVATGQYATIYAEGGRTVEVQVTAFYLFESITGTETITVTSGYESAGGTGLGGLVDTQDTRFIAVYICPSA